MCKRSVTGRAFGQLALWDAFLVEQVVDGEDPQAKARGRNERLDRSEWRACGDRERQRPNAHATDQGIARCPAMQVLRGTGAEIKDAHLLGGIQRGQDATTQATPGRILGHLRLWLFCKGHRSKATIGNHLVSLNPTNVYSHPPGLVTGVNRIEQN